MLIMLTQHPGTPWQKANSCLHHYIAENNILLKKIVIIFCYDEMLPISSRPITMLIMLTQHPRKPWQKAYSWLHHSIAENEILLSNNKTIIFIFTFPSFNATTILTQHSSKPWQAETYYNNYFWRIYLSSVEIKTCYYHYFADSVQ